MLILSQVGVGIFLAFTLLGFTSPAALTTSAGPLTVSAFAILNAGLGVSVLHLGRPLGAWRAFLGLRRSWMSREIVGFSLFAGAAAGLVMSALWPTLSTLSPYLRVVENFVNPGLWISPFAILTSTTGLLAVFCSAMIYIDTNRPFWAAHITVPKFFGTTLLLGSAGAAVVLGWLGAISNQAGLLNATHAFAIAATVIQTVLFGWESMQLLEALRNPSASTHRSSLTIWRLLKPLALTRVLLFLGSMGFGIAAILSAGQGAAMFATLSFLLTFASQTVERYFFFAAVDAPRMPGGVAA